MSFQYSIDNLLDTTGDDVLGDDERGQEEEEWSNDEGEEDINSPVGTAGTEHYEILVSFLYLHVHVYVHI